MVLILERPIWLRNIERQVKRLTFPARTSLNLECEVCLTLLQEKEPTRLESNRFDLDEVVVVYVVIIVKHELLLESVHQDYWGILPIHNVRLSLD